MEANWLAKILDDIEGYACENGLAPLLAEVRNARRITSLELGNPGTGMTAPTAAPVPAQPDSSLPPSAEG